MKLFVARSSYAVFALAQYSAKDCSGVARGIKGGCAGGDWEVAVAAQLQQEQQQQCYYNSSAGMLNPIEARALTMAFVSVLNVFPDPLLVQGVALAGHMAGLSCGLLQDQAAAVVPNAPHHIQPPRGTGDYHLILKKTNA